MKNIVHKFVNLSGIIILPVLLLSLFPSELTAQTLIVKGQITAANMPVRYAYVSFADNSNPSAKFSAETDTAGNFSINLITSVNRGNEVPSNFKLEQNYPNPFKTSTEIPYKLDKQSDVQVTIYDILGRVVRKFSAGSQNAGNYRILWNGRNNYGEKVAAGIYFYALKADGRMLVKKMVYGTSGSSGMTAPVQILSSQASNPDRRAALSVQSESYTVTVENTDSTLPAVSTQQFTDVNVQDDTTLDFAVSSETVATVYIDSTQQIIRGYGGANILVFRPDMTPAEVNTAFGNGPGQLGFTILRISIPSSGNTSDFAADVPTAKLAESLGAKVFATPWSPPASMKTNNSTVGGYLDTAHYADFAAYLKSFADYMAGQGAPMYAISIQNEPDANVNYLSCYWTADDFLNFCKNNAQTIGTRIMMPESESFVHALSDPTLEDSTAASHVAIIGGHIYGGGLGPYPLAKSKGKDLWMTEHLDTDTTWAHVLGTGMEINNCMNAGMNAYVWWYLVRFYGPIDDGTDRAPAGSVTKRGYVMSQFSKFIRPGYYKVESSSSPQRNVYMSAYRDSSSSKLVIVAINNSTATVYQTFSVENGSMSSFTPYTTSQTENVKEGNTIKAADGRFTCVLEPSSITTFVSN